VAGAAAPHNIAAIGQTGAVPITLLFPSDVLEPAKVDAHFRSEAVAARELGIEWRRVDHDAVLAGDMGEALARFGESPESPLLYRGWMIPPNRYRELGLALAARGASLVIDAERFAQSHHLPSWYEAAAGQTAESIWTSGPDLDAFVAALGQLGSGAAVVKDYSKSEKAYWDEAMFIPDVTDTDAARAVANRFVELRDEFFDGGFVVRRFEEYQPGECRTWWIDGECALVTAHPDTPETPGPVVDIGELPRLNPPPSSFFTMDIAREQGSGRLRIVEIGDGQVSDRPSTTDATTFMAAISTIGGAIS